MMKVQAPTESSFTSWLRSPAVAARVGTWLGVCFGVAFITGLYSHFSQDTPAWLTLPTRPVDLYRWTQGLHVISGCAAVPLLLVKLWTVYPRLFAALPRTGRETVRQGLERGAVGVLVASAIFQLVTGLQNTAQWYPWGFQFRRTHYAVAWIAIGALLVHIAVKLPVIVRALTSDIDEVQPTDRVSAWSGEGLSRRSLLRVTYVAAGASVLVTAGMAVPALRRISVFAVRSGGGPQGVPVNKSAEAAGVIAAASDPGYRLRLRNRGKEISFSRAELLAMPQHKRTLPIACVEGWSVSAEWTGVVLRDLLGHVGWSGGDVMVRSLQQGGSYSVTSMPDEFVRDGDTLLALTLNGEDLDLDHGFPCRVIAPARPGVLQTKWVAAIEAEQ